MTQQNRVDPWGVLNAVPARGSLMGNRGILHDDAGRIVRAWASASWLTCVLKFNDRTSPGQFRPGHYSKLFFLDEATAFAAGHRPCAECQRARYKMFRAAWTSANVQPNELKSFSVKALDRHLHGERFSKTAPKGKPTFESSIESLPFGTMIEWNERPYLVARAGALLPWSFEGYGDAVEVPAETARVLTPISVVRMFTAGFEPHAHPSAR